MVTDEAVPTELLNFNNLACNLQTAIKAILNRDLVIFTDPTHITQSCPHLDTLNVRSVYTDALASHCHLLPNDRGLRRQERVVVANFCSCISEAESWKLDLRMNFAVMKKVMLPMEEEIV
jgi:hypothetical protein